MFKKNIVVLIFSVFLINGLYAGVVEDLAFRIIGEENNNFVFEIEDKDCGDYFELDSANGKILITGNKAYSQSAGFYYYLKKYNNSYIGQNTRHVSIPQSWPMPEKELVKSIFEIRNAYNYCTFSYTMAFWDWDRWEEELDLLALYGVNQPLMIVGLEKVWQESLIDLGFDKEDIDAFIPGSAYKAWWLMGNLEGEAGPVSQEYIDSQYELAKKILERMRDYGMQPISQGFFGMVPRITNKYYPKAKLVEQGLWGSFPRPPILAPNTKEFRLFAETWYEKLHNLYGLFSYYGGDLFHEGGRTGNLSVSASARNVEKAMQKASPGSKYVLQGWGTNPKSSLLRGLSDENTLIQRLSKNLGDDSGNYGKDFKNKTWTINFINNFGGNHGMFSNLEVVARIPEFLQYERNENCIGIGYLCEGTENNPVFYDLLSELFWTEENIDVEGWIKDYTMRRYGELNDSAVKAWKILNSTIYKGPQVSEGASDSVIGARPAKGATRARSWSPGIIYWDRAKVQEAGLLLLEAADDLAGSESYLYDLTDLFRQITQDLAYDLTDDADKMLELIKDAEALLASNKHFLLGSWLDAAYKQGRDSREGEQFVRSAKQLVTRWEPRAQHWKGIKDYSNRAWSGLVGEYYHSRWELFFTEEEKIYEQSIEDLENDWIYNNNKTYSVKPEGDTIEICKKLSKKYLSK